MQQLLCLRYEYVPHTCYAHLYHGESAGPLLDEEKVHQAVTKARVRSHGHVVRDVRGLSKGGDGWGKDSLLLLL